MDKQEVFERLLRERKLFSNERLIQGEWVDSESKLDFTFSSEKVTVGDKQYFVSNDVSFAEYKEAVYDLYVEFKDLFNFLYFRVMDIKNVTYAYAYNIARHEYKSEGLSHDDFVDIADFLFKDMHNIINILLNRGMEYPYVLFVSYVFVRTMCSSSLRNDGVLDYGGELEGLERCVGAIKKIEEKDFFKAERNDQFSVKGRLVLPSLAY